MLSMGWNFVRTFHPYATTAARGDARVLSVNESEFFQSFTVNTETALSSADLCNKAITRR